MIGIESVTKSVRNCAPIESSARAVVPNNCLEVSIVMPCLNEAETLGACIDAALEALRRSGLSGEVLVADNGSVDGSQAIAVERGVRVIQVAEKGYGNALRGGIEAARGQYVVLGDADDSYDFLDVPRFVEKLREGYDLVMGNRFSGGILPGAMPWKHRYIGNPVLSGIGRLFFQASVGDFHCGLRAFSRDAYQRMELCTTGMEYASEMVIKSALKGLRIAEIPTKLRPDGRSRPPHLRSWRDGWRHLKFMLLLCPRWLFFVPGTTMTLVGLIVGALIVWGGPLRIGPAGFDIHTLLVAGLAVVVGSQLLIFAIHVKRLSILLGIHPPHSDIGWAWRYLSVETGVVSSLLLMLLGTVLLAMPAFQWQQAGFGPLNPEVTMRTVIPAVVFIASGGQFLFGSFFLGFLGFVADQLASARKT